MITENERPSRWPTLEGSSSSEPVGQQWRVECGRNFGTSLLSRFDDSKRPSGKAVVIGNSEPPCLAAQAMLRGKVEEAIGLLKPSRTYDTQATATPDAVSVVEVYSPRP